MKIRNNDVVAIIGQVKIINDDAITVALHTKNGETIDLVIDAQSLRVMGREFLINDEVVWKKEVHIITNELSPKIYTLKRKGADPMETNSYIIAKEEDIEHADKKEIYRFQSLEKSSEAMENYMVQDLSDHEKNHIMIEEKNIETAHISNNENEGAKETDQNDSSHKNMGDKDSEENINKETEESEEKTENKEVREEFSSLPDDSPIKKMTLLELKEEGQNKEKEDLMKNLKELSNLKKNS